MKVSRQITAPKGFQQNTIETFSPRYGNADYQI